MVKMGVIFKEGEKLLPLSTLIVEGWDKVISPAERSGSVYRKWREEFSEQERFLLGKWHTRMYQWVMRTGHPQEVEMDISTYALLERAANFFAQV